MTKALPSSLISDTSGHLPLTHYRPATLAFSLLVNCLYLGSCLRVCTLVSSAQNVPRNLLFSAWPIPSGHTSSCPNVASSDRPSLTSIEISCSCPPLAPYPDLIFADMKQIYNVVLIKNTIKELGFAYSSPYSQNLTMVLNIGTTNHQKSIIFVVQESFIVQDVLYTWTLLIKCQWKLSIIVTKYSFICHCT